MLDLTVVDSEQIIHSLIAKNGLTPIVRNSCRGHILDTLPVVLLGKYLKCGAPGGI